MEVAGRDWEASELSNWAGHKHTKAHSKTTSKGEQSTREAGQGAGSDGPLDFIFRLYNFHQVISSAPTFFFRIFSLLKSNPKVWEHSLVEKLTNKENRTTDLL